jgi:peptide methionine sulfoxide reductase msrA/msrB
MSGIMKIGVMAIAALIMIAGWKGLDAVLRPAPGRQIARVQGDRPMVRKIKKSDKECKRSLTVEQGMVTRPYETEPPFSGKFNNHFKKGTYVCAACKIPLFRWDAKYDHGTGWPSFTSPLRDDSIEYLEDRSFFMKRIEVRCAACGAHLGHVFDDGPAPSFEHYCINSASLDFIPGEKDAEERTGPAASVNPSETRNASASGPETAIFAAGCFWGVEYKFHEIKGVKDTEVGYTGGKIENPDYRQVCTDRTGHAEAVRVTFDPLIVSYEDLVRFFFAIHDPTQVNRQGPDVGTQYRSMIFTADTAQKETAQKVMEELRASGRFEKPIATGIVPASKFTRAEETHQRYYEKNKKKACAF